ncbi:PilZ domain-containing protein [Thiospirochaeta perfilievii]|uniref:PilZ domain-containing protein n=1 Tax=Thiospirochaeta perfilievii TaxID=252967 RepID=A0A5C1QHF9_9SPIO|nr:PilZ domain-containing protein [Thiospirochaeta perfilievii]QEN05984.1 PilZ domain-containing protein [Thiospirochaeta perfilievii]
MSSNQFGKKVFFLYPHSVIQQDVFHDLISSEYEIYKLVDYRKVKLLLKKYNDSIIFINIDENLTEQEWFDYVQSISTNEDLKGVQIGILTYNENHDLAEKYLMDLSITCGFIQLKLGKEESKQIILKTLEVNECKGKRKYIRATSTNKSKSTFNVQIAGQLNTGTIHDISSVGMSCIFDEDVELSKNALLRKMQLKLNGKLILVDGIVFGSRDISDKERLVVIMFTNSMSDDSKNKIHGYIGDILQSNIEKEVSELYV